MYSKLSDEQKLWVLTLTGKELYSKVLELKKRSKTDPETIKQLFSFWLNQNNIRHDQPFNFSKSDGNFVKNTSSVKLYWEKYDESISIQSIKNEFEKAWNNSISSLQKSAEEIFN